MKDSNLQELVTQAVESSGNARVVAALQSLIAGPCAEEETLTIISNAGVHSIPSSLLRGEVYEASRGDWNASTQDALIAELQEILLRLVTRLRLRQWRRIYLIPTGHPILSLQIKAMVFRILRLNTIDLYYKGGSYFEVDINQRAIALDSEGS